MDLGNLELVIDSNAEFNIHNSLTDQSFLKMLDQSNIDIIDLSTKKKKHNCNEFHEFNFLVKRLHEQEKLNIVDCCLCIEREFLKIEDIIKCLNEENCYLLRLALAKRNNIKVSKNLLDLYMY
jgi:hypothetical protein